VIFKGGGVGSWALAAGHWCSWEGAGSLNYILIAEEGATQACWEGRRRGGRSAEQVMFYNGAHIQDYNFHTVKLHGKDCDDKEDNSPPPSAARPNTAP